MVAVATAALVVFAVLFVAGIVRRAREGRDLQTATEEARRAIPQVAVIRAERATDVNLTFDATTQGIQDAVIYARTSGYLRKRYVDIGDRVNAGQLLAEIESPEVDQLLRQARADLNQSEKTLELQKANLFLANATLARYQAADAENAVAKEAVDQSVAASRTAQAAVAAAEANVASFTANVRRLEDLTSFERVIAPFSGVVIQRSVDVGALITAGSPTNNTAVSPLVVNNTPNGLFEVARLDELRVFVNVPQAYSLNVVSGLRVRVRVRGRPQPVIGTVTRTASALDVGTRTLLTEVDIPNPSHELLPGMFVYVDFAIPPSGTRWRVPASAVIIDAQGTRVLTVAAGNTLHYLPVELGRDFGSTIDECGRERAHREAADGLDGGRPARAGGRAGTAERLVWAVAVTLSLSACLCGTCASAAARPPAAFRVSSDACHRHDRARPRWRLFRRLTNSIGWSRQQTHRTRTSVGRSLPSIKLGAVASRQFSVSDDRARRGVPAADVREPHQHYLGSEDGECDVQRLACSDRPELRARRVGPRETLDRGATSLAVAAEDDEAVIRLTVQADGAVLPPCAGSTHSSRSRGDGRVVS
jgi:RND family efflux transporter MFP subunit